MKYIIYHLWIISLLFPLGMQAKVRLTSIWGDNMVLQQQSEVTFHGKASANSKITIEASWNHRKLTTRSDQHGNWNIQLPDDERHSNDDGWLDAAESLLRQQGVPILLHSLTVRRLH